MGTFEWNGYFTLTTFLTGIVFSIIIISAIFAFFRFEKLLTKEKIQLLLVACIIALIRMFLPIEIFYTKSIYIEGPLIPIIKWFRQKLFLSFSRSDVLFLTVLGIAFVIGAIKIIQYSRFLRRIKKLSKVSVPQIAKIMTKIQYEYGKKISYCVLDMPGSVEPFMFGFKKAYLVIGKKDRESENLEFIIRHEIEHFMHHDNWYKLISEIACILFWWNPYIYILRAQLSDILEFHNDEKISAYWNDEKKLNYAACLVKIAKDGSRSQYKYGMGMSCNRNSLLKKRVESMLEMYTKEKKKTQLRGIYTLLIVLFLVSYSIVVEPDFPYDIPETFSIDENTYVLYDDNDGTYHIMNGDKDEGCMTQLPDLLKERVIYEK